MSEARAPGIVLRGGAMGLADAVPGVSGGTMALLLGIHPRLVRALAHLRLDTLQRGDWRALDLGFLLLLGVGLALGLFVGARVLVVALVEAPRLMAALLLGLVVGGVRAPARRVSWDMGAWALALSAGALAFLVTVVRPVAVPDAAWFLPVAGAVAAVAMILPGISGSYLLLLMGLYEPVLAAVAELDLGVVALVGAGAAVGLLSFSRALHHLLEYYTSGTHAAMVGLLVGSLGRLWPWRDAPGFAEGAPTLPSGGAASLTSVLLAIAAGWLLVRALEAAASGTRSETEKGT